MNVALHPADQATMTTLELAKFINDDRRQKAERVKVNFPCRGYPELRHDSLMKKVADVLGEAAPKFVGTASYENGTGGMVERQIYRLPKREACLLAMSYSYELQAKVFDRMTELEQEASSPRLPKTMAEALRLAADQAELIEQQQAALAIAAPKAEFVDRYVESTGNKGFREVCKLLRVKETDFREFLKDAAIMYKLAGEWVPYAQHLDAGRFVVKAGTSDHGGDREHAFNQSKFTPKGVSWVAGEWAKRAIGGAA